MSAAPDDILPARQMGVLVAAGLRDWPSPLRVPAYLAALHELCDAIDADGEHHTLESWERFLAAVERCRIAVAEGRQP